MLIEEGKTKVFNLNGGALGVFAVWVEDAGEKLEKPQTPSDGEISAGDIIVTNTDSDGLVHWELINTGSQLMNLGSQDSFRDSNADCSIEVRFKGRISRGTPPFDDGPDHRKLGPYVGRFERFTGYSFRFEVRGSVTNGTIGRIGTLGEVRELGNGGEWTIWQVKNPLAGSNRNGLAAPAIGRITDDSPKYLARDNAGSVTVAVNGGRFAWHDGPGFIGSKDSPVVSASMVANFSVGVENGTKYCAVSFHILSSFERGRWSATIRPGYLWPR